MHNDVIEILVCAMVTYIRTLDFALTRDYTENASRSWMVIISLQEMLHDATRKPGRLLSDKDRDYQFRPAE